MTTELPSATGPLALKSKEGLGAGGKARSYPACKGRNCGCTDGFSHSAECQEEHEDACNGVLGPCSVPMWWGSGCPAGTCGNKAYGKRPPSRMWMNYGAGRMMREDLKFDGFAPGLACPVHGGPEAPNSF
jgi:hypothetical protein